MKKDAYYFSHFCNARHDRKIRRLRKELGIEGYGIFFMLLEVLREQIDFKYPLNDIDLLAEEFNTSEAKLKTVILSYDLFQLDETGHFYSNKFIFYLKPYIEKTERARSAAIKRWSDLTKENNANALQMECVGNARKGEESKGDESRVDESKRFFADEKIANEIFEFFSIDKEHPSSQPKLSKVKWFLDELQNKKQIEYFSDAFNDYRIYQLKNPKYKYSFDRFIGDIGGDVFEGCWNKENWKIKIIECTSNPNEIKPIPRTMVY